MTATEYATPLLAHDLGCPDVPADATVVATSALLVGDRLARYHSCIGYPSRPGPPSERTPTMGTETTQCAGSGFRLDYVNRAGSQVAVAPCPRCGQTFTRPIIWTGQLHCVYIPNHAAPPRPTRPARPSAQGGTPRMNETETEHADEGQTWAELNDGDDW